MNESPENYNVWSAISAVSAVLKDNVWYRRGNYKVYPNQYIILVGHPGIGKGTAINPAHKFVKDPPSTHNPLANYIQDRITASKLVEILAAGFPSAPKFNTNGNLVNGIDSTCILQAEELSTMVNSSDWLSDFLTKTWEGGDFIYTTKGGGKKLAKDLCPSLIGACTPSFIKNINKNHGAEISNGFTARTIFVFATENGRAIPFPLGFEDHPQISALLSDDLMAMARLHGEYKFSKPAEVLFRCKYMEIKASACEEDSDVVKNFKSRQPTHIIKVAMALSAATSDALIIEEQTLHTAISLIDGILKTLDFTFSGVGDSELAESIAKIKNYIDRKGVCGRKEILRDNMRNITTENLDRVLFALREAGIIEQFSQGTKQLYKPTGATP